MRETCRPSRLISTICGAPRSGSPGTAGCGCGRRCPPGASPLSIGLLADVVLLALACSPARHVTSGRRQTCRCRSRSGGNRSNRGGAELRTMPAGGHHLLMLVLRGTRIDRGREIGDADTPTETKPQGLWRRLQAILVFVAQVGPWLSSASFGQAPEVEAGGRILPSTRSSGSSPSSTIPWGCPLRGLCDVLVQCSQRGEERLAPDHASPRPR